MSAKQRKQMIEPNLREPSISRQCQLLSLSRLLMVIKSVPFSVIEKCTTPVQSEGFTPGVQ